MKPKLTKNDLESFLERQNLALSNSTPTARLYGLASEVLIHLLGAAWVGDNVFGNKPLDQFLRSRPESKEDRFKMTDRLVDVAEMLFNFQSISGIENLFENIKKDKIESYVGELQSAKLLHFNNTAFYFNTPSNQKGLDFDAVVIDQGFEIPCEFKCKIENTKFSENTIKEVLKHAREQLPKDIPSIIFIKLPENWTFQEEIQNKLLTVFDEFFRRTTRVNSIVYYWEEWEFLSSGQALRAVRFNEILNPNSKVKLDRILRKTETNQVPPNWIYFSDLIQSKFGASSVTRPKPIKAMVLGNGFSWHSVIKILPQISRGEHVFFDLGTVGGTRISFLIDDSNFIKFRIIDGDLKKFEVSSDKPFYDFGLNNFCYLRFQLTPNYHFSELAIAVNNEIVKKRTVTLNQGSILLPTISLGADFQSRRKTAFELASMAMYEQSSVNLNLELTNYYNVEFALYTPKQ